MATAVTHVSLVVSSGGDAGVGEPHSDQAEAVPGVAIG